MLAMALVLMFIGGWERYWRLQDYVPSIEDHWELWGINRRFATQQKGRALALIGASRIQLGVHPDVFARSTGIRPLMLAIDGNSPLPVLQNLADDPGFSGLVICSLTPQWLAESKITGRRAKKWIRKFRQQKWSSRLETRLSSAVQQRFVFRFPGLSPGRVWSHLVHDEPLKKVYAPMRMDRYRSANYAKSDLLRLKKAREKRVLQLAQSTIPLNPAAYGERLEQVSEWVASIEQRGGQVLFVRMPSTGVIRETEEVAWPRHRYWDPFSELVKGKAIHFEDYPTLAGFTCPDGSHLDGDDAVRFTEELVKIIRSHIFRLEI